MVATRRVSARGHQNRISSSLLNTGEFRLDGGELYTGVPRTVWLNWTLDDKSKKSVDRQDRVRLLNHSVLIEVPDLPNGGRTITLIGTGMSSGGVEVPRFTQEVAPPPPNRLIRELKRSRLKQNQVDRVILPSLHYLVGSNLVWKDTKGDIEPNFPEAEYVISRVEYEAAMNEDALTGDIYRGVKYDLDMLERKGGRIRLIDDVEEVGSCIKVERHGGFSTGYCSTIVTIGSERLLISPLFFPTPHHIQPEIQFSGTLNRQETFSRKKQLLQRASEENLLVSCPMDPSRSVGYIQRSRVGEFSFDRVESAGVFA